MGKEGDQIRRERRDKSFSRGLRYGTVLTSSGKDFFLDRREYVNGGVWPVRAPSIVWSLLFSKKITC